MVPHSDKVSAKSAESFTEKNFRRIVEGILPVAETHIELLLKKMSEADALDLCNKFINYAADLQERIPE